LAELQRLGLLERVLRHERDDVAGRFADTDAHDRDVEVVERAIRDAQAVVAGSALALLGELPAGWDATTSAAPIADSVAAYRAGRHRSLDDWSAAELDAFARMSSSAAAVAAIWAAQGMDGRPGLGTAADRQALLERGHKPIYRGIHGDDAADLAEEFRTGERPFVGFSRGYGGSGHLFTTHAGNARLYTSDRAGGRSEGTVLAGYLHRDAIVLRHFDAILRQEADISAAEQRGDGALARLMDDLGAWAALNGVDAIVPTKEPEGDIYLVQNRTAVIVERAPEQGRQDRPSDPGAGGPGSEADSGAGRPSGPAALVLGRLSKLFPRRGPPRGTVARLVMRAVEVVRAVPVAGAVAVLALVALAAPAAAAPSAVEAPAATAGDVVQWVGGGLAAIGLVVLLRWRASVKRKRAWADNEAGWNAIEIAVPPAGSPGETAVPRPTCCSGHWGCCWKHQAGAVPGRSWPCCRPTWPVSPRP
jgi:hypothetical protein